MKHLFSPNEAAMKVSNGDKNPDRIQRSAPWDMTFGSHACYHLERVPSRTRAMILGSSAEAISGIRLVSHACDKDN